MDLQLVGSLDLVIAVLAAGRSERFGADDKLAVPFRGKPLGLHATDNLVGVSSARRFVIVANEQHPCSAGWRAGGFETVRNAKAHLGMGTSIALAASLSLASRSGVLLICLADMPLVPKSHVESLVGAALRLGPDGIVASTNGEATMPPACFRQNRIRALTQISGDQGARALLPEAEQIACAPELMADIDDPDELSRLASKRVN